MKKTLLLLAVCLFAFACKKDEDETLCYACTVESITSLASQTAETITTEIEQCGLTAEQAKQFEASGTSTITSSGMTVKTTTKCTKK